MSPARACSIALIALLVTTCGGESGSSSTDDQPTDDQPTDAELDIETSAEPDVTHADATDADATDARSSDPDADPADGDTSEACEDGAAQCSDDGLVLHRCVDGAFEETRCMAEFGQLCEDGACVDPWSVGAPVWPDCADEPRAAAEGLLEKAEAFDEVARRLHLHPDLGWATAVGLPTEETECPERVDPPCRVTVPPIDEATWRDATHFASGGSDGLWNSLYITSQAFRYAVTGDADTLANLRLLMRGQIARMRVTGVPGLFARAFRPPDTVGISCPETLADYVPDVEKDDDRWVRIGDGGCATTYDPELEDWVTADHCGMNDFAGWCFRDNASQDGYAGHMMALAAVWRLVDDEEIQEMVQTIADEVGGHLLDNELTFVDWDGRVTEHGKLYATALVDSPGFLAAQALGWIKLTAEITGRQDLHDFYGDCLLQRTGAGPCIAWPFETGESYVAQYLPEMILYIGPDGCESNANRLAMAMANLWTLLQVEHDPETRRAIQQVLDEEMVNTGGSRAISVQGNAWFDFIWASSKFLGPESDGPALAAVESGVCSLRQFAASRARPTIDHGHLEHYCDSRLGDSATEHAIPVADRCPTVFTWWRSPYRIGGCTAEPGSIEMPADYLLAYWMGRYYGFIAPEL